MDKEETIKMFDMTDYYIGLGLALCSSGFIGLYFIMFIILFNIFSYLNVINYKKMYIIKIIIKYP